MQRRCRRRRHAAGEEHAEPRDVVVLGLRVAATHADLAVLGGGDEDKTQMFCDGSPEEGVSRVVVRGSGGTGGAQPQRKKNGRLAPEHEASALRDSSTLVSSQQRRFGPPGEREPTAGRRFGMDATGWDAAFGTPEMGVAPNRTAVAARKKRTRRAGGWGLTVVSDAG